ncbi:MAG: hypothetical protein ACE5JC_03785 [Candidatus Zixiibacteriota bacterium]
MLKRPGNNSEGSAGDLVPTARDFSPASIRRALRRYTRDHWATRYSAVPLGLSILGSLLFGFSEVAFLAIAGSLGLACLPWVYIYYIRAGNFEHRYVERLQRAIREQTERKRERLKQDLIDHECTEGAQQLDKLQAKFDSLDGLLLDKLDPSELTFKRYRGIALEVFLSGVDNLAAVVSALKSISEIDVDYINKRLQQFRQAATDHEDREIQKEMEVLETRLKVRQKQLDKIKHLLLENEQAMTQLDETTVAIADMDTGQDEAEIDMENSMVALAEITERAKRFS